MAGFDVAREEWTELAERGGNLFSTWEWATTWWRHFGRGEGSLRLTEVCSGDGATLAILPLYLWRRGPLRLLRLIGHGPGDQLGPVCDPADVGAVGDALRTGLEGGYWRCDGFLGEVMPGDQGWPARLGAARIATEGSPVCTLAAPDWEAFLSTRSRNHRRQIRRDERRLADSADLRYRRSDDDASLDADLDILFGLHEARWDGRSSAADPAVKRFQRDFAFKALEAGWLRLWFLELNGRAVAGWYGFRFGNAELYYLQGRDPDYEKQGVGGVLCAHTVRTAFEEGAAEYRFLRGDEPFKYRFADTDPGLQTVARATSPLGRLVVGSVAALRRSERGRRFVVRHAGG